MNITGKSKGIYAFLKTHICLEYVVIPEMFLQTIGSDYDERDAHVAIRLEVNGYQRGRSAGVAVAYGS